MIVFWTQHITLNMYTEYTAFLANIANWIKAQSSTRVSATGKKSTPSRSGHAIVAIRHAPEVWLGVGVYTVCKIFFMAGKQHFLFNENLWPNFLLFDYFSIPFVLGLSPFLSEREVFDNPSRMACLCDALWAYQHKTYTHLLYVYPYLCVVYLPQLF